ncbi:MAG: PUA domain-containing protein, partial [Infirmifilum sp.]
DTAVDAVCHGAPLAVPGIVKLENNIRVGDEVAILTLKNELVAVGRSRMTTEQMTSAKSGIAIDVKHVVMDPGTYPKAWK